MLALHETTSDYIKRVFLLYWKVTSAGGLSLLLALGLASPEMQRRFGPYALTVALMIFVACLVWVIASEYRRHWQRLRYTTRVAVSATFNIKIVNEAGDAVLEGYREVVNRGKVPIKNLPQISVGYVPYEGDDRLPDMQLSVTPPAGKNFKLLNSYSYRTDDNYLTHVWNYQIPEGLDSGEKITYSYVLPAVPRSENDAFNDKGSIIILDPKQESYERLKCYVTAPNGYRFVLLGTSVRDEFQNMNAVESKRVMRSWKPYVALDRLEGTLRWEVHRPFPRHDYECRYKLARR